MFPNSPPFNGSLTKVLAECHKGTQTNISAENLSTITDPKTSENGSLTIFEFNKLVQDPQHPKDVTIIKDVFTEETHDHGSDTPGSENAKSNRYTYCREVIKPFLNNTSGCPLSDEELIRDALLSAHQDYPDYQPCFEKNDGGKTSESSLTTTTKKSKSSQTDITNANENSKYEPSRNNSDKDIESTSSAISTLEEGKKKSKKCKKTKKCKDTKSDSSESVKKSKKCKNTNSDSSEYVKKSKKCKDKKSDSSESVNKSKKCNDKKSDSSESVKKSKCKDKKSDSSESVKKSKKCIDTKSSSCESVKKSKKCKDTKSDSSESAKVSKNSSKHSLQSNMSESNLNDDDNEYCPEKKRNPKCPKKTRRPTIEEEVFKIEKRPPAGPPSACKRQAEGGLSTCKDTPSVETCEEKKTKESTSKKKTEDENPCKHQISKIASIQKLSSTSLGSGRPKSIADAHDETMATIKIAFEDFVGKVYQSTKDAVTLLKSESARQISNLTSKKSENCEISPRKVNDDHDEQKSNKFKFFRDLNDADLRDRPKDSNQGLSDTAQMVVGKLINTVSSTVSMISSHESSSAYDKPIEEAEMESNSTSVGNRIFTSFKSKIMSIFGENETKIAPRTSNESAGIISSKDLNDKQIRRPK